MILLIVHPTEELNTDVDFYDRFADVKERTLSYLELDINIPAGTWQCISRPAPLGAVMDQSDADRLISALGAEFPDTPFTVSAEHLSDQVDVAPCQAHI